MSLAQASMLTHNLAVRLLRKIYRATPPAAAVTIFLSAEHCSLKSLSELICYFLIIGKPISLPRGLPYPKIATGSPGAICGRITAALASEPAVLDVGRTAVR